MCAAVISVAIEVEEHGLRHAAPHILQRPPIEAGVDLKIFVQSFQQTTAVLRGATDQLGFLDRYVCHYGLPRAKKESRIMMPHYRLSPPLNSDARLRTQRGSRVLRDKEAFHDR